jgi:type III secretion protein J
MTETPGRPQPPGEGARDQESAMRMWVLVAMLSGLLGITAGCAGEEVVVHGLEEWEANEILVVLEARGISGTKVIEEGRVVAYNVMVSGVDKRDAMKLLVANQLPRKRPMTLEKVYPAGSGGLIPTKSEERAKYLMALQGEVERKLLSMPGIVKASVSIVQPEKDIVRDLDKEPPPSTASVAIVYNPIDERGTPAVTTDEVTRLVAASVEELKPSNVQVVMKRNVPMQIVDTPVDEGQLAAPVAVSKIFNVGVSDKKSAQLLQLYAAVLGGAALFGVAFGVGALVRSSSLKRRAQKSEAELTSLRKAGRATQTGLQQPPG